jgi:hypothetical protein
MRRHRKTSTAKHRLPAPKEVNRVVQQHTMVLTLHATMTTARVRLSSGRTQLAG